MKDLDNAMENLRELEERENRGFSVNNGQKKTLIGKVEQFYSKIGVVAITLSAELKVGDLIEIGSDDEAIRQRISSMQIEREDVEEASAGDSVGIKVKHPVEVNSNVYRIEA